MADFKIRVSRREAVALWCLVDSCGTGRGDSFTELGVKLARQFDAIQPECDVLGTVDDGNLENDISMAAQNILGRVSSATEGPDDGIELTLTEEDIELIKGCT